MLGLLAKKIELKEQEKRIQYLMKQIDKEYSATAQLARSNEQAHKTSLDEIKRLNGQIQSDISGLWIVYCQELWYFLDRTTILIEYLSG